MDQNRTLRAPWLVGLLAAGVVAAYLVGHSGGGPARAAEGDASRTATVQGLGRVSVVPDQLVFTLGVEVIRPDLQEALSGADAAMKRVTDALVAQGVDRAELQTAGLSMYPEYRGKPRTLTGYHVSQSLTVVLTDLGAASAVVSAGAAAGGEAVSIDGVQLQVGDPEAALAPARAAAYEQAKEKAAEYADQVGADLGPVVRVSEVADGQDPASSGEAYAADSAASGLTVQPGENELAASVTVVFALE